MLYRISANEVYDSDKSLGFDCCMISSDGTTKLPIRVFLPKSQLKIYEQDVYLKEWMWMRKRTQLLQEWEARDLPYDHHIYLSGLSDEPWMIV